MALDLFYLSVSNQKDSPSWKKLVERFPYARFVQWNDNVVENYINCAKLSYTKHFYTISESLEVDEDFDFSYVPDEWSQDSVHVWKQKNSSGIETGHGGVFLFNRRHVLDAKILSSEFDTGHFEQCKFMDSIATITPKHKIYKADTFDHSDFLTEASNDPECKTDYFWVVDKDVTPKEDFAFDFHPHFFHSNHVHIWQKENAVTGLIYENGGVKLFPKRKYKDGAPTDLECTRNKYKPLKYMQTAASVEQPYDIVMLSYHEPTAEENYKRLCEQFPNRTIKRVKDVKGIFNAHKQVADIVDTKMFYVVDADAHIEPTFKLDHQPLVWDLDIIHVWRCKNPINDLVYGYGGVKLFPTDPLRKATDWNIDFTTSVGSKFKAMPEVSNVTAFNVDPFNTWKSAFRECTKLASKIIERQKNDETDNRLNIWCSLGKDKQYGEYAIAGAKAGRQHGTTYRGNKDMLNKINDYDWLRSEFEKVK